MTGRPLRGAADLAAAGLVPSERLPALERVAARYAVSITPDIAELIDPADPADPIARQFVPDAAELETAPEELADPIGDGAHGPVPGIVHRYPDRVLLKPTHLCPVYCRFCFRREVVGPGEAAMLSDAALDAALAYIAARPEVWEVILTGGDPLILSPRRLGRIMAALGSIPHMRVVRLHILVVGADIADVGKGEGDHLPGVGGIGHHLLISGHGGVEAQLAHRLAFGAEPLPPTHPPVGEYKCAGGSLRHGGGHRTGHRWEGSSEVETTMSLSDRC